MPKFLASLSSFLFLFGNYRCLNSVTSKSPYCGLLALLFRLFATLSYHFSFFESLCLHPTASLSYLFKMDQFFLSIRLSLQLKFVVSLSHDMNLFLESISVFLFD